MIRTAPASLERARETTMPALREVRGRLHPAIGRIAAYHAGHADASGMPTDGGGKAIRPALALLSAEAAGAPPEVAVPGAVAVELIHDFSLLHDDVMDGDRERRHRPAAWAVFGESLAILAGDALVVAAQQVLLESGNPWTIPAMRLVADAAQAMIGGQVDDLAFEPRGDVRPAESERMVEGKTGALLSCASAIGAVLGGAPNPTVSALRAFGLHLGMAFQAQDDLLGIRGDPEVTGKPRATDLRRRKKTLPVTAAMWAPGPGAARFRELIGRPPVHDGDPDPDLPELVSLVDRCGGERAARDLADRHLTMALSSLDGIPVSAGIRGELEALARFVVDREA
ncbi:MAG TPA: polyprenyl synthetase family protein [Actinomycetota bacterium]